MWRAHGLVRKADLILALLLLGASSSLQSDSMQIAPRTLCCRPLPAFSPFFFLSRANQSPLERLPCSGLANNIKPRGMDLAKSPSSVVDDRAPLPPSLPKSASSLDGRRLFLSRRQLYPLSATTVSVSLRTHRNQTRPQLLQNRKSANQELMRYA